MDKRRLVGLVLGVAGWSAIGISAFLESAASIKLAVTGLMIVALGSQYREVI